MNVADSQLAVATYSTHVQAETAIKELQRLGFDMKKISIVGRDYRLEEHVVGFLNAGTRAKIYGKLGAFWGGLLGVLFGSALFSFPALGPVVALGPIAALIFSGLEGAVVVGGVSALAGALTAIGIPKDSVLRYQNCLQAGEFLLVVHGDEKEVVRAKTLLAASGHLSFEHHIVPGASKIAVTTQYS
ncbi:general stress protein [Herbaspirillum camelliae]|uniref:general stress protein n=1 Tax=Herbaspirillum camelliae TaxID=1892903 RepID=UPI000949FC19|nr:general stress protein [Herbaspirillum camelliae]